MLNRVILIGRLGKSPELRYTPNGTAVCNFSIAVDRDYGDNETDWFDIVVWRKQAEACANYIDKGSLVAIDGRLQFRSYETNDGQKRKVTEVVANNVKFLDSKGNGQANNNNQSNNNQQSSESDISVPF